MTADCIRKLHSLATHSSIASSFSAWPAFDASTDRVLDQPAGQVNNGITHPLRYGFGDNSDRVHLRDGGRSMGAKQERSRCPRGSCLIGSIAHLSFIHHHSHTEQMNDLESLRAQIGSEANPWTLGQLEQLKRDVELMAELLLDLYCDCNERRGKDACGLSGLDVPKADR